MKTKWMLMMAALLGAVGMANAGFVTIGNAGNDAQSAANRAHSFSAGDGYGGVSYTYQISDREVTIAQMQASGAGDGDENYWNDGTRTVGTAAPASYVSLYEAMKYCNYLTSGNVNTGAYVFSSGVYQSTDRASAITTYGTVYALPTEDEWYKAAYYKPDNSGYSLYANGTDTAPGVETDSNYGGTGGTYPGTWAVGAGAAEQNGTYDMMGNVYEWMEDSAGVIRGGSYVSDTFAIRSSGRLPYNPSNEINSLGFRVVAIPEPATAMLLAIGGGVAWLVRLKQRL